MEDSQASIGALLPARPGDLSLEGVRQSRAEDGPEFTGCCEAADGRALLQGFGGAGVFDFVAVAIGNRSVGATHLVDGQVAEAHDADGVNGILPGPVFEAGGAADGHEVGQLSDGIVDVIDDLDEHLAGCCHVGRGNGGDLVVGRGQECRLVGQDGEGLPRSLAGEIGLQMGESR